VTGTSIGSGRDGLGAREADFGLSAMVLNISGGMDVGYRPWAISYQLSAISRAGMSATRPPPLIADS
jgi:hypothetical protein